MTFDAARIPDKLKEAYREKRCAVLVGAGASAGAGLPLWGQFLDLMISEAARHLVINASKAKEYRELIKNPDKYLLVASGLKEDLKPYFDEFLERTFISPKPTPTKLHEALVALDRTQFVVTTNYDTIIERAYRVKEPDISVCTFRDAGEVQRRLSRREFFILKAHGDAAKVGNGIILTDADYRNILFRQRAYQSLLSAMFTMFTIIFVGASMTDPEIMLLLNFIVDSFSTGSGPSHFAVMAQEDITEVEKDRWFKDFNIQLIPISKAHHYAELTDFLVTLQSTV
jgi:SIR2-like domain